MESLELIVVVAVGVLAMGWLSRRTGLSEPLLLLGAGCLIGLTPSFAAFALSPGVVLFLFLPALLYWEALTSSVREIRNNFRSIALQSTGLVLATAVAVAAVAHALGYSWPIAFVLGAVLAPTDAAAVAAVATAMPRRILTVLRAESLLNDGTALVLLAVTIEVVTDEQPFSWSGTAVAFVESYAGGILIGAAVALLLIPVRRRLPEPLLHSVLSVATPFLAYLPAELLHVSGVLAVVICGLVTTRFGPRVIGSDARIQAVAFWEVASYLLNSALFILVGIQLPAAVRALTSVSLGQAAIAACAVSVAVIGTRLLWFYSVPYLVRFLDRRPQQRDRRITAPQRLPLAWAGMRGAISLAAALTVPAATAEGHVVEQRERRRVHHGCRHRRHPDVPRSNTADRGPPGPLPRGRGQDRGTHPRPLPYERRRVARPTGVGAAVRGPRGGHPPHGPGHRGPYGPRSRLHATPRERAAPRTRPASGQAGHPHRPARRRPHRRHRPPHRSGSARCGGGPPGEKSESRGGGVLPGRPGALLRPISRVDQGCCRQA
nr:Na+/H+ antiporter [Streptomyces sp. S1D4-11]